MTPNRIIRDLVEAVIKSDKQFITEASGRAKKKYTAGGKGCIATFSHKEINGQDVIIWAKITCPGKKPRQQGFDQKEWDELENA